MRKSDRKIPSLCQKIDNIKMVFMHNNYYLKQPVCYSSKFSTSKTIYKWTKEEKKGKKQKKLAKK